MSKGMKGVIASLALLGLGVFLGASPAVAQSVAGIDDRAPQPVTNVQAEFDEGGRSITVSWPLSGDDVVRQVPTSSDFTTGGTFKNVNDVVGYNIWRCLSDDCEGSLAIVGTVAATGEIVGTVATGEMEFVDETIDVSEGSKRYFYMVSVFDARGNGEEDLTWSEEVKNMLLIGDFDYDGDVDLDDYGFLEAYDIIADMDDDGDVDLDDFFRWADYLGNDLYRE